VSEDAISRGQLGEDGELLSMIVEDVVTTTMMGTVLLGYLQGPGQVRAGDWALCDELEMEIRSIEQFRKNVSEAEASSKAVGLAVDADGATTELVGRVVHFAARPAGGVPQLSEGGVVVPDQAVLVGWSEHRRSPGRKFAVLILDGLHVRLVDVAGHVLVDALGESLSADIASGTQVALRAPDGTVRYVVGPLPQWGKHGDGADLVRRYNAKLVPDPRLIEEEGRFAKLMVTPATSRLRYHKLWPAVLLKMLQTRGVQAL
jgi:hypothetical protein